MRQLTVRSIFLQYIISLCWKFHQLISSWEAKRLSDNLSQIEKLDPAKSNASEIREAALNRAWLKRIIPKFPYWTEGHISYAELSLVVGDVQSAYAASITSEQIGSETEKIKARGLKGIALLRFGQFNEARELLEEAYKYNKSYFEDEYIACLIARGEISIADSILKSSTNNSMAKKTLQNYTSAKLSSK